ncbi:MAG: hypothetical protein ABI399_08910 [Bauldia sp.]
MKSSRPKTTRKETPEDRAAAWTAQRNAVHERLRRSIMAWARTHERCPLAGCRRNGKCLHQESCRVRHDAAPLTPEQQTEIRRIIEKEKARRLALGET